MQLRLFKSKLHMARVTGTHLHYHGSVTVPRDLMDAVGLLAHEAVLVANVETGQRGETYVIEGEAGSGEVELNGAIARLAEPGDRIIVIAFAEMTPREARDHRPKVAVLDEKNRIVEQIELPANGDRPGT